MKKHLATIIGIVLALGVAFAAFTWDEGRRNEASLRTSNLLFTNCYEGRRAATGAPVSQEFPECNPLSDAYMLGQSARTTSAAMFGAAVGAGFALLYFGGLWFRRRRAQAAAAG